MIAIKARLFINGNWLKDVLLHKDITTYTMDAVPETPRQRLNGPVYVLVQPLIHFKQSWDNPEKFMVWGVPKRTEALLFAEEKRKGV